MLAKKSLESEKLFRLCCTSYPEIFSTNKIIAKQYFRQFGHLKRIIYKQKSKVLFVEYSDEESYLNALHNAGEYNGYLFLVTEDHAPPTVQKRKKSIKNVDPDWTDDPDIRAELQAMGGIPVIKKYNLRPEQMQIDNVTKEIPKLKRNWKTQDLSTPKDLKKVIADKISSVTPEQMELLNIIKQPNITTEDKFRCLDARDKYIRIILKRNLNSNIKTKATVGCCPDMCPEKERLMRVIQHQVALYEQATEGKGMNPNLAVKQYSRSSADQEAPLPYELRPVNILQMTMGYLLHKIIGLCELSEANIAEWYHFLWDRTRGIRKDITQQELCCQGSVELIEQCARFHIHCSARLVNEDPSVFDQKINTENLTKCLQTLKYMYHDLQLKGESCCNEAEFRAYIILLNLNDGNFMWEVQQLKEDIQKSPEVKFALNVYSALDKKNYVKFFKLLRSTTYLNACILMRYFVQVRTIALKTFIKCFVRKAPVFYPIYELINILAFDDKESAESFCLHFGLKVECENLILNHNSHVVTEFPYSLERSLVVEQKRTISVSEVICGKSLPPKYYETHIPFNSFDNKGFLIPNEYLTEADLKTVNPVVSIDLTQDDSLEKNISMKTADFSNISKKDPVFSHPGNIFLPKPTSKFEQSSSNINYNLFNDNIPPQNSASIFGQPIELKADTNIKPRELAKPNAGNKNVFGNTFSNSIYNTKIPEIKMPISPDVSEAKKHDELREIEKRFVEQEEKRRLIQENIEKENQMKIELERKQLEFKKKQEEELRRMTEQRKQEEELRKRSEELKLKQELKRSQEEKRLQLLKKEKLLNIEINTAVKELMRHLLLSVETNVMESKLNSIKTKMKNRLIRNMFYLWKQNTIKNKRKRKYIECSPAWGGYKSPRQEAIELRSSSQDLTLQLKNRYRCGVSYYIDVLKEHKIKKIDILHLTSERLIQRHHELETMISKNIFWKITVSLPNEENMTRVEETLDNYFQWKVKSGTKLFIEQFQVQSHNIIYCIQREKEIKTDYKDTNGIIFIANNFNTSAHERLQQILRNIGEFVKIPIVLILQNFDQECQDILNVLKNHSILSDYAILKDIFNPQNVVNLIDESLMFLSKKVEKPPPLELDTFKSFVSKYICTETWKKANSFAKWNTHYKSCLNIPNIVIQLYNEGLTILEKMVLNEMNLVYSEFPNAFREFLNIHVPDYLPCDYKYFPSFWKNRKYLNCLTNIFKKLRLPQYKEKWPPNSCKELESHISLYIQNVFKETNTVFYKLMIIFFKGIDPNVNFNEVENVLWTDVIELISMELLKEQNLSLINSPFENKSVFNEYVVVYNLDLLKQYQTCDWFYLSNPLIDQEIKKQLVKEDKAVTRKEEPLKYSSSDIDRTLMEISNKLSKTSTVSQIKQEYTDFHLMMTDLEDSIKTHKKINKTFETTLKTILSEK